MKRAAYTRKIWKNPKQNWWSRSYTWRVEENKRPWRYGSAYTRIGARAAGEYWIRVRAIWKWLW